MPYTPTVYTDGTPPSGGVTSTQLNKGESGIQTAQAAAEAAQTTADAKVAKANLPINARDYGVVADGVTDDTTALQAALNAAAGRWLLIPRGTYLITAALTISTDTQVSGDGWGTVIKVGGAAHTTASVTAFSAASKARVIIESLRIVGPEDGTMTTANSADAGRGVFLDAVTDFVIRDVHISRFNIQGIYMGACVRGKVTGCTVLEIYSGNGISVDGLASDIVIADNTLATIADCAIGVHNGALRTVVASNVISDTNFGRGVDIYGAPETLVKGNAFKNVGGSGAAGHGVLIYPGLGGTLPHRCVVIGNSFIDCTNSGVLVDATTAIYDTVIAGNLIQSCGGEGIHIARAAQRTTISGNSCTDNTGAGVYLEEVGAQVPTGGVVTGNTLSGNATYGCRATASANGFALAGNSLAGNTSGTHNLDKTLNSVSGNASAPDTVMVATKTASYTLALVDAGAILEMNSASAQVFTIPPNSSVAFPIGTTVELVRIGAGSVTITPGTGVTLPNSIETAGTTSRTITSQYTSTSLYKRATDTWVLSGSIS